VGTKSADRLDDLLRCPRSVRLTCHVDVEHAAPLKRQNEEDVDRAERHRRHGEESSGDRAREVVAEERAPRLRRRTARPAGRLRHVLGHRVLVDGMTELGELVRDASADPERVVARHPLDQLNQVGRE
jgi:hypothetical protein